ncbi:MAG: hypothetical protein PHW62_00910 [Candidatus Ratteibacteria bacterium]|nr:hypothetical protein [Candidatus Ratteibacteria bacterium]
MAEKTLPLLVKERVWDTLTSGLDPEDDPCGDIDDIKDNTSYAIDITIYETAKSILEDIEKADDPKNNAILVRLKKRWLVPCPLDPKDDCACDRCGVADAIVRKHKNDKSSFGEPIYKRIKHSDGSVTYTRRKKPLKRTTKKKKRNSDGRRELGDDNR